MRAGSCWREVGLCLDSKRETMNVAMKEDDRLMLAKLQFIGKGQDSRPMTSYECQDGMNKQIQCKYGGETSYGNWKYR